MVKEWVYDWFIKNGVSRENLADYENENYFKKGLIDSFGFLGLISSSEEAFDVIYSEDDFARDEIFTINGLIKIIEEKKSCD